MQDVVSNPGSPNQVTIDSNGDVASRTYVPAMARVGAAWVVPHRWTASAQLTGHLGTSYDRFSVAPQISQRLRLQDHIERSPVVDLNIGGEYLLDPEYSFALGFFTDLTGAPHFALLADGTLAPVQWHPDLGGPEGLEDYVAAQAYAAALIAERCLELDPENPLAAARGLRTSTFFGAFELGEDGLQVGHRLAVVRWNRRRQELLLAEAA